MWIALVGSGNFSCHGFGSIWLYTCPPMNVSLVINCVYICLWILFPCFIYVLSVTHMSCGYRVFLLGVRRDSV